MALNPPSKRKSPFSGIPTTSTRARKLAKTQDARTLAVQSADAALSATGDLDVAAYVGAREFEIRALEDGMQRSKTALTSRAFQKVPRSLRRRTASHNVKRIPRRLRARGRREMVEDNTPIVTARRRKPTEIMRIRLETARRLQALNVKTKAKRVASKAKREKEVRKLLSDAGSHTYKIAPRVPKIKKNKLSQPPSPESKFKKRQRGKTWLPTHLFHAKRARMTPPNGPLWRFSLPMTPTEKSYRPTHRAAGARGAVVWDMSYISTIQLEGTESSLDGVLRAMGIDGEEAWGGKGKKWRQGSRSLHTWVCEQADDKKPIAPVTLIWCTKSKPEDVEMSDAAAASDGTRKKRPGERIFVRTHPSAFPQVWNQLLVVSKRQNPPVMVEDLRFEIGSIEVIGPGSTEALISALRPLTAENKAPPKDSPEGVWPALLGVTNPSSLPANALLAFAISDPRLHFPLPLKPPSSDSSMNDLALLLSSWPPDKTQNSSSLFDRPARLSAIRLLPSQKAINRRRTLAGPGIHPPPQPSDPQIPIIVLASRPHNRLAHNGSQGRWTILLPWRCVVPLWYSIMFYPLSSGGNPRFGGLKEQQQLAFENAEPWFPGDFPGTKAGWEWGLRDREDKRTEWERRPKGKRTEFESIDLGNGQKGEIGRGWACDWERLIQGPPEKMAGRVSIGNSSCNADKDMSNSAAAPRDGEVNRIDTPPLNIQHLGSSVATSIINHSHGDLPMKLQALLDKPYLFTVKISLSNRGTPTPCARIYRLPTRDRELRRRWLSPQSSSTQLLRRANPNIQPSESKRGNDRQKRCKTLEDSFVQRAEARQQLAASLITPADAGTDKDRHLPLPLEEDLIGFVTTGNYNLSEGKGTGIGSILLSKVVTPATIEKKNSKHSQGNTMSRMCIVRSAGDTVGRLGTWEIV
ncbi:hypothetical protein Egran_01568 [Elaphomyces granulatus]|uniref:Pop1 N-terminal domain-containing protein n=1 Tax=Elaphomyces granulatus TaxID=519963 RepID=A0A232M2R0_9EURO|nr:hypothetical protein Egran_01568 [Elaphomyces granulatus]